MENYLKNWVQYLKTALEITLLKSKVALAAAQNSRTSPYTLSQTELIKFVTEMHLKIRYTIDSNINNTITTAMVVKKHLCFIIEIPLLDVDKYFNFYSFRKIPTFHDNVMLYPDIKTKNLAILADGSRPYKLFSTNF